MRIKLVGAFALSLLLGMYIARAQQVSSSPMLALVSKFTDPKVPASGPAEIPTTRNWPTLPADMPTWPGKGLSHHKAFFLGGEGYNVIQLIADGKIVWTYQAGRGGEIDDCWMLSNGNLVFTTMRSVLEITPDKQVVWKYDCPANTECHSCQPIGTDKVLIVQNELPGARFIMLNKKDNSVAWDHRLPSISESDQRTVHAQVRNARMTKEGTFLVPLLQQAKVIEYDRDWKEILVIEARSPWSALRVQNGNILVAGNAGGWVREFNRKGEMVWEVSRDELPGISLKTVQGLTRLSNGNTIISSLGGPPRPATNPAAAAVAATQPGWPKLVQCVEVTPDKKIVWVAQQWQTLGPCSWVQVLDEPGVPENGDVMR